MTFNFWNPMNKSLGSDVNSLERKWSIPRSSRPLRSLRVSDFNPQETIKRLFKFVKELLTPIGKYLSVHSEARNLPTDEFCLSASCSPLKLVIIVPGSVTDALLKMRHRQVYTSMAISIDNLIFLNSHSSSIFSRFIAMLFFVGFRILCGAENFSRTFCHWLSSFKFKLDSNEAVKFLSNKIVDMRILNTTASEIRLSGWPFMWLRLWHKTERARG